LKHHPDKGGDEEKFKLCNEAFGVLNDDQKRARYDSGADDVEMGGMGGFGGGDGVSVNLADLFAMNGGMGGMHGGMPGSSFGGAGGPFGGHQGGFNRRSSARPPPGFSFE
jgi:DnaJ family protein C protein 7